MNILYSRYSRIEQENNGVGNNRLYSKDIVKLMSPTPLFFFCFFLLECREYKMSIFGIFLYFLKLPTCSGFCIDLL